MLRIKLQPGVVFLSVILLLFPASHQSTAAQELKIAMKAAVDNGDPHQLFTPNRNVQLHVYEPLIFQDRYLRPVPGLAESWQLIDPETWDFTLRAGSKFHDGTPLIASDVVFSIKRAQSITGVRTYRHYLKDIADVIAVNDRTVRIKTQGPTALLLSNLSTLGIMSRKTVEAASAEDVNLGRPANGTGPYRWVRRARTISRPWLRAPRASRHHRPCRSLR